MLTMNQALQTAFQTQNMTTKEPDDSMIEVGIASVEAVFDWKTYLKETFPDQYPEGSL